MNRRGFVSSVFAGLGALIVGNKAQAQEVNKNWDEEDFEIDGVKVTVFHLPKNYPPELEMGDTIIRVSLYDFKKWGRETLEDEFEAIIENCRVYNSSDHKEKFGEHYLTVLRVKDKPHLIGWLFAVNKCKVCTDFYKGYDE